MQLQENLSNFISQIFLGGEKEGYGYQVQTPGAIHHARWMTKAICIFKMCLLQHQLSNFHHTKKKITNMALFVVFVYQKPRFRANSVKSAASNDITLFM